MRTTLARKKVWYDTGGLRGRFFGAVAITTGSHGVTMSRVIKLKPQRVPLAKELVLPEAEHELYERMLNRYADRRRGALRHMESSIRVDLAAIRDFHAHAGQPPWRATTDHFEDWCKHLAGERRARFATQRRYQVGLAKFYSYLIENTGFRNEVQRRFSVSLEQVAPRDLRLSHAVAIEGTKRRPALDAEQIDKVFQTIEEMIDEAVTFHSKSLLPLRRDKAMFYCAYVLGIRAGELAGLNLDSFSTEPKLPELGRYGVAHVWGKGANGSGPRYRAVPVTTPHLPPMLRWYEDDVRPALIRPGGENETAFFLSERGKRMTVAAIEYRFKVILQRAGLDGRGFSPHCLRHSSVSHQNDRVTPEMNRLLHGHSSQAVTQTYTHVHDAYIRERTADLVKKQIEQARQEKPK
jgi:site-specific recombinase XerD